MPIALWLPSTSSILHITDTEFESNDQECVRQRACIKQLELQLRVREWNCHDAFNSIFLFILILHSLTMPQCIWIFLPVGLRKFCNLLFLTNLLHPCIPFSTFTYGFHFCTYSVSWFDLLRVNWLICFLKKTISSHYIVDCALTLLLFYSVESWIVCVLTIMDRVCTYYHGGGSASKLPRQSW